MARLVMKFGGTSVANIDRIRNVARHVKREVDAGHDVAVVVSAMAGKNNDAGGGGGLRGPERQTNGWIGPGGRRRCMMRANMTPWWPRASRSPPGCWRSRCR